MLELGYCISLPYYLDGSMEERLYRIDLYDLYGELLTEKQQNYFEDYYFSNLSLAEIAENMQVSRNAVHNVLKDTEEKLVDYENKLHLYEKSRKIKDLIQRLDEDLRCQIEELL